MAVSKSPDKKPKKQKKTIKDIMDEVRAQQEEKRATMLPPEVPRVLDDFDTIYLYDYLCKDKVIPNFLTWPKITLSQARTQIKKAGLTMFDLTKGERNNPYGDSVGKIDFKDSASIKRAFIEKRCTLSFAIPLLIEHVGKDNIEADTMVSFMFAWVRRCTAMSRRIMFLKSEEKFAAEKAKDDGLSFQLFFATPEEYKDTLDFYCATWANAHNASHESLVRYFKDKRRKEVPYAGSQTITEFRASLSQKVPRSLIQRGFSSSSVAWERWKRDAKAVRPPHLMTSEEATTFALGKSFKFHMRGLDIDWMKNIPFEVISGQMDYSREVKYLVFRKTETGYKVTGKYLNRK